MTSTCHPAPQPPSLLSGLKGFGPFVEACIDHGNDADAKAFALKVEDPVERAGYFLRLGLVEDAEAVAKTLKDADAAASILSAVGVAQAAPGPGDRGSASPAQGGGGDAAQR